MATNYKRVNLDGKSITETRIASEDLRPGTFVFINDDDEFQQADTPTGRLYVVNAAHDQGLGIDDVIPEGESVTADYVEESREFSVLAVPGTYRKDDPIAVNINGRAEIGSGNIVGYSQDTVVLTGEKFLRIRSLSVGLGSGGSGGLTPEQESKLNGIQPEATKNQSDAYLLDRANHTGSQPISTVTGLSSALDSKVDKVAGKGLSDTNYTQAEKDKLAGLESSRFKGQYVSLAALQAAHPTAGAGDYANVDEGVGFDVQRYVWDTSDNAWVKQLGVSSQLTAAQIKQEYESNPDTNVFTDSEKQKLDSVEQGAQVNTVDSVNGRTGEVTGLVEDTDPRLSDSREWSQPTVTEIQATSGAGTTRLAWTVQRVWQAIAAWWLGVTSTLGRTLVGRTTAAEMREDLGLGSAATHDVTTSATDTTAGRLLKFDDFGIGSFGIVNLTYGEEVAVWEKIAQLRGAQASEGAEISFTVYGAGNFGQLGRETLHCNAAQRGDNGIKLDVYSISNGGLGASITVGYVQVGTYDFDIYLRREPYNPCTVIGSNSALNGTFLQNPTSTTTEPAGIIYATKEEIYHTGNTIVDTNGFIKEA